MNVRYLGWTLLALAACRGNAEEPLLTPPPAIAAPVTETAAAPTPAPAAAPAPAAPRPTPPQPQPQPTPAANGQAGEIRASHILIMHRGSTRVPPGITRSQDEARARAQEVLTRVRRGEDFAALARQYSDEPGAAQSGGDLGRFGHGRMVPTFEQAAFALRVNQVSEIVETPFGYHIIKRTE